MLRLAERNEETQETAAPTGENSLTTTCSRPFQHSQYAQYKYLTEEGEVTGSSMVDWISEADARRRREVMEEDARAWVYTVYGCGNTSHQCEQFAIDSITGFARGHGNC